MTATERSARQTALRLLVASITHDQLATDAAIEDLGYVEIREPLDSLVGLAQALSGFDSMSPAATVEWAQGLLVDLAAR